MKITLREFKKDFFCLFFLLIVVLVFFIRVFLQPEPAVLSATISPDLISSFFPWSHFGFGSIKQGTLPLWNPYVFGGFPFLAEIHTSIFYPLNLIFLFLPSHIALNLSEIVHIYLAGLFTYLFCLHSLKIDRISSLLGAVTFMFSAPVVFHVYPGHVSNLYTMAWIPLVFLTLESFLRRRKTIFAVALSMVFALQILAGHAQYVFYTLVGAFFYMVVRIPMVPDYRRGWFLLIAKFLLAATLSACLTAAQILVIMEAIPLSIRSNLSFEFISSFSFPPENLLTLFIPTFFGDLVGVPYWGRYYLWEMCIYIGTIPLILAAVAVFYRRSKYCFAFVGLALLAFILALGKFTPLLKLLCQFVPGFNLFRGSSKFTILFVFSLAVLSGIGANFVFEAVGSGQRKRLTRLAAALSAITVAVFLILGGLVAAGGGESSLWRNFLGWSASLARNYNPPPDISDIQVLKKTFSCVLKNGLVWGLFLFGGSVLFILAVRRKIKSSLFAGLILFLTIADLGMFGMRYVVTRPLSHCFWDEEVVSFLKKDREPYRVGLTYSSLLGWNQGMNHGIAALGGYFSKPLRRYNEFFNLSQAIPLEEPTMLMAISRLSRLTDLLNLKYIIVPAELQIEHPLLKMVFQGKGIKIYQNQNCLPRAFLVHRVKVIREKKRIFFELSQSDFDPGKYVILEEEPPIHCSEEVPAGEKHPRVVKYDLNKVIVEAEPLKDGFLILSDTYYPGWKVYVDGREEKIYCADYVLRAVFLPKGVHQVEFIYSPLSFKLGVAISLFSLVGVGVLVAVIFRREKRRNKNGIPST